MRAITHQQSNQKSSYPGPNPDLDADAEKLPDVALENPDLLSNTLNSLETTVESEFHHRTWFAVVALLFLNYVQVFCLLGPPQIVCFFDVVPHSLILKLTQILLRAS